MNFPWSRKIVEDTVELLTQETTALLNVFQDLKERNNRLLETKMAEHNAEDTGHASALAAIQAEYEDKIAEENNGYVGAVAELSDAQRLLAKNLEFVEKFLSIFS